MKQVLRILLLLLFGIGGGVLTWQGFSRVDTLRTIERIPRTPVLAAIPGEVNLRGTVETYQGRALRGPDTGVETVYFRYKVEREHRDSEGRTSWLTIEEREEGVPFLLRDTSGAVIVDPNSGPRLTIERKRRRESSGLRYTEWRIDPSDTVFVMGVASADGRPMTVRFNGPGDYVPILSSSTENDERAGYGTTSLLMTGAGLVFLALAVFQFSRVFRIHYTPAYVTLIAITLFLTLSIQGYLMTREDLTRAYERLNREFETRESLIRERTEALGIDWTGDWGALIPAVREAGSSAPPELIDYIIYSRVNLIRALERTERIRRQIPERWIAPFLGLKTPEAFELLPAEAEVLAEMESSFEPSRAPRSVGIGLGVTGTILSLVLGRMGLRRIRTKRWIENIPTVSTRGVVYGIGEVKGKVAVPEGGEALSAPLTGARCSGYQYIVKERRGSGKNSKWVTLVNDVRFQPFLCSDTDGSLLIDAGGSETILKKTTRKSEGRRRYTEHRLEIDAPLYAIGPIIVNPDTHDSLVMMEDASFAGKAPFVVSDYAEEEVISRKASSGFLWLNFGMNAFMLAGLGISGMLGGFGSSSYLAAALAPVAYVLLLLAIILFNDLVFLQKRAEAMWANIDVSLKKRFDLLPQLVEITRVFFDHEKEIQESVAELRSASGGGNPLSPESAESSVQREQGIISRIRALREAYPELKANQNATDLFNRIRDLEDEIALMRNGYNYAVEVYNTRIAKIPEVAIAKAFKFRPRSFFNIADTPQAANAVPVTSRAAELEG